MLGMTDRVVVYVPPMVGSLFSWKSLLTKRMTREDWNWYQYMSNMVVLVLRTFPTAASPSSTSLTLLLGLGCADVSAIVDAREDCDLGLA